LLFGVRRPLERLSKNKLPWSAFRWEDLSRFRRLQEESSDPGTSYGYFKIDPGSICNARGGPVNLKAQVIVLCYHRFEDNPKDSLALKPADFEAPMQALRDNGITVSTKWRGRFSKNSTIPLPCSFTRTT
jgi:hypothetical protein